MSFRDTFGERKVVLPVVHARRFDQTLRNVQIAQEAHADGVFLIGHDALPWDVLARWHRKVRKEHPDLWIGLNFLDLKATTAMRRMRLFPGVSGLWTDNARINEHRDDQPKALQIQEGRGAWDGLYFGGVAFKHQQDVDPDHLADAARRAAPYMDVVTTSGPATGVAADVDKLRVMKEALGEHPLAVASGVTVENVGDILPYVDCFLVATGISTSFTELDPSKVQALVERVHE